MERAEFYSTVQGQKTLQSGHKAIKTKSGDEGIPRVAAIRTENLRQRQGNEGPYHIITTTADCWDGFEVIKNFVRKARIKPYQREPI
jgi:hypothetical protein